MKLETTNPYTIGWKFTPVKAIYLFSAIYKEAHVTPFITIGDRGPPYAMYGGICDPSFFLFEMHCWTFSYLANG